MSQSETKPLIVLSCPGCGLTGDDIRSEAMREVLPYGDQGKKVSVIQVVHRCSKCTMAWTDFQSELIRDFAVKEALANDSEWVEQQLARAKPYLAQLIKVREVGKVLRSSVTEPKLAGILDQLYELTGEMIDLITRTIETRNLQEYMERYEPLKKRIEALQAQMEPGPVIPMDLGTLGALALLLAERSPGDGTIH